jgi:hypothetical protein
MMSVDELLKAVDDLSEPDLDHLVDRALFVRARRKANVLTADETRLLLKINQGIPEDLHREYLGLVDQRDAATITDTAYTRMLELGDRIELIAADRAEALAELAVLRQVSLMKLMDDLGIHGPGVR